MLIADNTRMNNDTHNKESIVSNNATHNEYNLKAHKATKADIASGNSKRCTKEGCPSNGVPLKASSFHKDKSQKSGLCVWCAHCEGVYEQRRQQACKELGVTRRRDLTTQEQHERWDEIMRPERSRRYRATA